MPIEQIFNKKKPNVEVTLEQLEGILGTIKVKHPEIIERLKNILG